jgi:hypothetical protein
MRTKPDANRAVATVNCIAYKATASAWATWPTRAGIHFDYHRADSIPLTQNQRDQNNDLLDSADLSRYDAVVICCARFHVVFGMAKLEKF